MSCADQKSGALSDFVGKSFAAGGASIQIYEQTTSISSEISCTKANVTATIPANTKSGKLYLKVSQQTDGVSNSPPTAIPPITGPSYLEYEDTTDLPDGGTYTSTQIPKDDTISAMAFTIATCGPSTLKYGWILSDQAVVTERNILYKAVPPGTSASFPIVTPDEYFCNAEDQSITTSETNLTWTQVKLTSSGAASRDYPQTTDSQPVDLVTPSSSLSYSSNTPGFDKSRFGTGEAPYRPCILLILSIQGQSYDASATSFTAKLYINSTLVSTVTGLNVNVSKAMWAFSVKGIGDYGTNHPPQNNPSDSYDGWTSPVVRVSLATNAGTASALASTKLIDYVVNYPF